MTITYDTEHDILRLIFTDSLIEESDEVMPGFIFDYDAAGNCIGLEILDASQRVQNPLAVDYAITGLIPPL